MAQKTTITPPSKISKASAGNRTVTVTEVGLRVPPKDNAGTAEHEKWLTENPEALDSIQRGLADLAAGRVHVRRSYAEYADTDVEN